MSWVLRRLSHQKLGGAWSNWTAVVRTARQEEREEEQKSELEGIRQEMVAQQQLQVQVYFGI